MFVANKFGWTRGERTLIMLVTPWIQLMVFIGGILLVVLFVVLLLNFRKASHVHHLEEEEQAEDGHEYGECCGHDHDHAPHHSHSEDQHECCHYDHKHDHEHQHGHGHHHGHECCGHDHDHGWNPIRYIPLLIPLILYLMGLPSDEMIRNFEKNLTAKAMKGLASYNSKEEEFKPTAGLLMLSALPTTDLVTTSFQNGLLASLASGIQHAIDEIDVDAAGVQPVVTDLAQIEKVLLSPSAMAEYARYRKVEIDGMFDLDRQSGGVSLFRIVRLRMACCLSDARPAMMLAATKKPLPLQLLEKSAETKWVRVQGKIKFRQGADGKWQALMQVSSVLPAPMPPFPYLN
jgi:hypothetical protein